MPGINGRKRIVITNVSPRVEGGLFPAKTLLNKPVTLSASVFCDGHEELGGCIQIRHESEKQWKELPLKLIHNDHWIAEFTPDRYGAYIFRVEGWIDHFSGWRTGFLKKKAAGQDLLTDIAIGVKLVSEAADRASRTDKSLLSGYADKLNTKTSMDDLLQVILADELYHVMIRNADRSLAVRHPGQYRITADRPKAGFSTWYELFPRSASDIPGQHGTFNDVRRLLPRIAAMGFDVLYLPPIHPIGRLKRKGKNNSLHATATDPGSPWAIGNETGGHKAIHPELGTMKDFTTLIGAAKRSGIELAMDIAFQCAPDHPYVQEHPEWFKWRPDGTVQYAENPPKKYEDILPLNFETEDWERLWQELKSVFDFWIGKGIEIFRVDNPHTKSFAFWEWVLPEIRKEHPQVIFLAEAFTRPRLMERLAKAGFSQSYTYFTWRNTKEELQEYMKELTGTETKHYFRPNFWPNTPDILPPGLTSGGEPAHIIRLILAATMSANYGLYGPVYELGLNTPYPGKEEYTESEKYEIRHWDWGRYTKTKELIARINRIRREHPALQDTNNIAFATTSNEHIIAYIKNDKATGDRLIIIVNLDPHNTQSGTVLIEADSLSLEKGASCHVKDLLSGDRYHWQTGWNYVSLNPHDMPAHVLALKDTNEE